MLKIQNPAPLRLLFFLAAIGAMAQSQQNRLTGRWRSTEASAAGVTAIFEFREEGRLDCSSAVISEGNYRLVGTDTIVFQSEKGQDKRELEWDSPDHARIEDEAAGIVIPLDRIGKRSDGKLPLLGDWTTVREWSGRKYPARVSFAADGKVVWITTLRTDQGRYSVQSGNIRLEVPGRPAVDGAFGFADDRLTLPNPKGGSSTFSRF